MSNFQTVILGRYTDTNTLDGSIVCERRAPCYNRSQSAELSPALHDLDAVRIRVIQLCHYLGRCEHHARVSRQSYDEV